MNQTWGMFFSVVIKAALILFKPRMGQINFSNVNGLTFKARKEIIEDVCRLIHTGEPVLLMNVV